MLIPPLAAKRWRRRWPEACSYLFRLLGRRKNLVPPSRRWQVPCLIRRRPSRGEFPLRRHTRAEPGRIRVYRRRRHDLDDCRHAERRHRAALDFLRRLTRGACSYVGGALVERKDLSPKNDPVRKAVFAQRRRNRAKLHHLDQTSGQAGCVAELRPLHDSHRKRLYRRGHYRVGRCRRRLAGNPPELDFLRVAAGGRRKTEDGRLATDYRSGRPVSPFRPPSSVLR